MLGWAVNLDFAGSGSLQGVPVPVVIYFRSEAVTRSGASAGTVRYATLVTAGMQQSMASTSVLHQARMTGGSMARSRGSGEGMLP